MKFDSARVCKVEYREFDLALEVHSQGVSYSFSFENRVRIVLGHENTQWEPGTPSTPNLLDRGVQELTIWDSGHIHVVLEDGLLECTPHGDYESWSLCAPQKQFYCLPGGEISIFTKP